MSPKKKKRIKEADPEPEPSEPTSVFWYLIATIAGLAAITMMVAACLPGWRVTAKAIYRYKNPTSDQYTQSIIEPSQWGLFVYHYNGGAASNPVQSIASSLCKSADFESTTNAVINGLYNLGCATTCQSHLRTRCTAYQRLADAGYITMGGCILAGILVLMGAIWIALVGKSYTALLVLWGIAVISNSGTSLYWLYETTTQFTKLGVESQYPKSHVGYAWWMNLGAGATYIICWLITAMGACIGDKLAWNRRQNDIVDFMLRDPDDNSSGFGAFGGGGAFQQQQQPPFARNMAQGNLGYGGFGGQYYRGGAPGGAPPGGPPVGGGPAGRHMLGPPGVPSPMGSSPVGPSLGPPRAVSPKNPIGQSLSPQFIKKNNGFMPYNYGFRH